MKKIYLITLAIFVIAINYANAQWTSLKAPNTGVENYGWLTVSADGKNIASYNTKFDLTVFQILNQYTTSHDYGATWQVYTAPTNGVQNMFWDGDDLYVQETNTINSLKKSSDFGATFKVINNDYHTHSHVVQSPTGKWYITYLGMIYVSTDKGQTWTKTANVGTDFMDYLVANNGNLVATASKGVAYSADGGATWIGSTFSTTDSWIDSNNSISKASDGTLIYLCKTGTRVYKSSDNGVSWQLFNSTLPVSPIKLLFSGAELIVLSSNGSTHKSTDGGKTFTQMTPIVNGILQAGAAMVSSKSNIFISGLSDIYRYGNLPTGISNMIAENRISVFPNPFTDRLHWPSGKNLMSYTVSDITGKTCSGGRITGDQLDLSFLKSGIYFLSFSDAAGNRSTEKIIKQ